MGFHLTAVQVNKLFFESFKRLADKKKEVFDEDLIALVQEQISVIPKVWQLLDFKVASGNKITPTATIELKSKNKTFTRDSCGDGPVDACYKAIDKITGIRGKLLDYSIQAVTSGKDALGEVHLRVEAKGKEISGRSSSTDIIEASAKAYLDAINKLLYRK